MEYKKKTMPGGWIMAEPRPSPEALKEMYAKLYYQNESVRSKTYQSTYSEVELAHKNLQAECLLYAIVACGNELDPGGNWPGEKASLMDVGCGEGFALAVSEREGWQVQGVDFSSYAIDQFHPQFADRVQTGDAFEILQEMGGKGEQFDVCLLLNVLEHVLDPVEALHNIAAVLRPGGIAAITVPNDYSAIQEKLMELEHIDREFWFSPPQHLNFFNTHSGPEFVRNNGFRVLDLLAGFPIEYFLFHPGSNYLDDPKSGNPAHLARIEIELLMAEAGLDNYVQMCRSMAACALGRNFTMIITVD